MTKAIIFDLDGTLLNRQASVERFIHHQYERLYESLCHIPEKQYISRFIELDDRGYVWKDKVYQQMVETFSIKKVTWEELLADYVSNFHKYCVAFPNLIPMLEQLQGSLSLGMITNGKATFQLKNIRALNIEAYFSSILISECEGISKPDPRIFQKSANELELPISNCIYVGDHPSNDVKGAQAVGMKAIWKKDPYFGEVEADYIIEDLAEIPLLLGIGE
ncbi:HAD family hydrolase [Bacillus sp. SD088]|uniref:HAD family hydrolase n=1 Tax=Bacillus sp. SD088 TaxID=2782012 RepID=UPI001A95772F|nr:HAD family hydrolase [Bacillus sp. SD088]MBO0994140.1 HAD family hydrolase [Bacillus sp. SD088]